MESCSQSLLSRIEKNPNIDWMSMFVDPSTVLGTHMVDICLKYFSFAKFCFTHRRHMSWPGSNIIFPKDFEKQTKVIKLPRSIKGF